MNSPTPEELRFELSSLTLAGKAWGPSEGTPILAIHGWLDNASTFDHLAPLLPEMRIVSVDMAGHGHSDHRPAGVNYHFVDMLYEVVELLDYLGWDRCSLLGHSMGAGVATCVAGLLGHRIQNVLLIEGLGPMTQPPERLTELMRDSFRQWRSLPGKTSPVYATMDEAVEARHIVGEMEIASVKTLVGRGLVQKNNSYKWRSDPRLRVKSRVYLTEDQILLVSRFTKNITVLFDGDQAGLKASLRGIDMLLEGDMNVKAVMFPDGEDPDSFSRSNTLEELTEYLNENAKDFIQFKAIKTLAMIIPNYKFWYEVSVVSMRFQITPIPCEDGVQNGDEEGVDCGGSCAACAAGKCCAENSDCASGVCGEGDKCVGACAAGYYWGAGDTGLQACGADTEYCPPGATAPLAAAGEACASDADCAATLFCTCATAPSIA